MSTRNVVLAVLGLALVVGFAVAGRLLDVIPVGMDTSAFPAGAAIQSGARALGMEVLFAVAGVFWLLVTLLAVGAVAFFAVRRSVRGNLDASRRTFLAGAGSGAGVALGSIVVAGAAGFGRMVGIGESGTGWGAIQPISAKATYTHPEYKDSWKGARVESYRRFGRTGWNVSDIVLGTGRIRGEDGEKIARLALDRGVNYFDTSPDYSGAGSEQAMGRAIVDVQRDQIFIATKFCTPEGHLPPGTSPARYIEAVEASLGRLGTDYVDLCHIHSVNSVDRLMDDGVHEAFDRLKERGLVRFLGFSTHTPKLVEVANAAIDSGRFDVMMLAYHHGIWPEIPQIVKRGRVEQDMGVVAMKTLKGAKHRGLENFQPYADSYAQAALKWAVSNEDVSCAVVSFFELQHVDEFLAASGQPFTERDLAILEEYDRQILGSYCAPHCGQCLGACPEQLAIHDVLRHRMYFEDYGWEKEGMRLYSALEKNASVCASCSAPCTGSCPVGIPIQERMAEAHDLLTLG